MFFMIGAAQEQRPLSFQQNILCTRCGRYGRYEVVVTFWCLRLFFIPVFRWGRQYLVRTTCCGAQYILAPEKGRAIEHGDPVTIEPADLTPLAGQEPRLRRCPSCGYVTEDLSFTFCPKCGHQME